MLVRATQDCFPDLHLRKAGEVFEYKGPLGPKSGPLVLVDEQQDQTDESAQAVAPKRRRLSKIIKVEDVSNLSE
jgi:hypothetical protein